MRKTRKSLEQFSFKEWWQHCTVFDNNMMTTREVLTEDDLSPEEDALKLFTDFGGLG